MLSNTQSTATIPPRAIAPTATALALAALVLTALLPAPAAAAAPQNGAAHDGAVAEVARPLPGGDAAPQSAVRRTDLPADRPLVVAFLAVDGVYNTELMAPYDVFHHTVFHTAPDPGMEVYVVSPDGRPVTTFEGIVVQPHYGFDDAPPADVLVVPSAEGSMTTDLDDERLISWVRRTGERARWVVSLCDGAFVLARAGLLDGRAATTFPKDYDDFAARFPQVDLRVNVSFVRDGKMLTSEGGARSYDVAMYLVEELYGEAVAQGVGSGLLIPWPPEHSDRPSYAVVAAEAAATPPPAPAPEDSDTSAASGP